MSERADKPNAKPDEQPQGGWRAASTGGWRTPEPGSAAPIPTRPSPPAGWRTPALPANLTEEPQAEGDWHLPRPEDTIFEQQTEAESAPAASAPPGDTAALPPEDLELYELAKKTAQETREPDADDDFAGMSELIALASLVDTRAPGASTGAPSPLVIPASTAADAAPKVDESQLSAAEKLAMQFTGSAPAPAPAGTGGLTPEEYARQQLAALEGAETGITAGVAAGGATGGLSAEEYARQQLEALGGDDDFATSGALPATQAFPPQPALDPLTQAQAQRYLDSQGQARTLRAQRQNGTLPQADFEAQMRALMIFDDATQVWWMLGMEMDAWYRFDAAANDWVMDTPPALAAAQVAQSGSGMIKPISGASLDYLTAAQQPVQQTAASQPVEYTQANVSASGGLRVDENFMPLPRAVPQQDPNLTQVGTGGLYMDPNRTVQGQGTPYSAPTVASSPLGGTPSLGSLMTSDASAGAFAGTIPAAFDPQAEPPSLSDVDDVTPTYEEARRRQQRSVLGTLLLVGVGGLSLVLVVGIVIVLAIAASYNSIADQWRVQVEALADYQPQFLTARILDAQGNLIAELNSQDGGARDPVTLDQVSPYMIHAVISTENERFFVDPGYDVFAIGRAFIQNFFAGDVQSGASTITMQIARNLILQNTAPTADRKLVEIVIAGEIARRYSKDFILQLYLNEFNFGNLSFGVQAASRFYFSVDAADLNMAQAALLTGLIQAPATYDPVTNKDAAIARANYVIGQMLAVGCLPIDQAAWSSDVPQPPAGGDFCITSSQARFDPARGVVVDGPVLVQFSRIQAQTFQPRATQVRYPHFVQFIQAQLEVNFGSAEIFRRGFTVRTTLVPRIQDVAQDALITTLAQLATSGLNTGAVIVTDPTTGAIRAMVGSPDFNNADIDGQVNNVFTWQQPGSSIKPIVYTGAFEPYDRNGDGTITPDEYFTAAYVLWDVPTIFADNYQPTNFDGQFRGPVSVRNALAQSLNVPAVKAYQFLGNDRFRDVATRMGLTFLDSAQFNLTTGIGSTDVRLYDMAAAYGTLATSGRRVPLYAIESITDATGAQVALPARPQPQQVVAAPIAYIMNHILSDDNARAPQFGAGGILTIPGAPAGSVAAKTGTSNNNRDLWTMGYTSNWVVGVWMGRVDNAPTSAGSQNSAAVVWNRVMQGALQGTQVAAFPNPGAGTVVGAQICADTGTLVGPTTACTNLRNELFVQTQPPLPATQSFVQTLAVDTWTGLRANSFCPDNNLNGTFANIGDPFAVQWINNTAQGQQWAQRLGVPLPLQNAPAGECDINSPLPIVRLISPSDGVTLTGTVTFTGAVTAPDFNRYQIEIASAANATSFQILQGPVAQQQPTLGQPIGSGPVDTTRLPNGDYVIRLAVFSNSGGYAFRTARITINNPVLPTPTPQTFVQPTPGAFPTTPFDTPAPFDTLPTPAPFPTPTATISVP